MGGRGNKRQRWKLETGNIRLIWRNRGSEKCEHSRWIMDKIESDVADWWVPRGAD